MSDPLHTNPTVCMYLCMVGLFSILHVGAHLLAYAQSLRIAWRETRENPVFATVKVTFLPFHYLSTITRRIIIIPFLRLLDTY